jgi:hypothetical protein
MENLYGYFTMQYTPDKKFTASLTGTYSGKMLVQHMESSGYMYGPMMPRSMYAGIKLSW